MYLFATGKALIDGHIIQVVNAIYFIVHLTHDLMMHLFNFVPFTFHKVEEQKQINEKQMEILLDRWM